MKYLIIICSLFLLSCSSDERIPWDKKKVMGKAIAFYPDIKELLPESMDKGIQCSDYADGIGCIGAFQVKVRLVKFIMVRFETEVQAMNEAKRIKQYSSNNWVFDDVYGEPVIESFVKKAFGAVVLLLDLIPVKPRGL